jgi:hypothetical protein
MEDAVRQIWRVLVAALAIVALAAGDVRARRTSALLEGPSTIARAEKLYLVVNANFDPALGTPNVAALLRNRRDH